MNNIIVRETCAEMRAIARSALKGNWQVVTIGIFIYYLMTNTIPTVLEQVMPFASYSYYYHQIDQYVKISYVSNLYTFVLSGAFSLGLCSFLTAFFRRKDGNPSHIFNGFEFFPKAFVLSVVQSFFVFLWTLLFIVPGIIAAVRYSQAYFILADDPSKGVMEVMRETKVIMTGNKMRYFALLLSFIGWALLSVIPEAFLPSPNGILGTVLDLVYSIPYFVCLAYVHVARVVFYDLATGHLVAKEPDFVEEDYNF